MRLTAHLAIECIVGNFGRDPTCWTVPIPLKYGTSVTQQWGITLEKPKPAVGFPYPFEMLSLTGCVELQLQLSLHDHGLPDDHDHRLPRHAKAGR